MVNVRRLTMLIACFSALWFAPPSAASIPLGIGYLDDHTEISDPAAAQAMAQKIHDAGGDWQKLVVTWVPGQLAPSAKDMAALQNAVNGAVGAGIQVCIAFWPVTWSKYKYPAPISLLAQKQFAHLVGHVASQFNGVSCWFIGNEPNYSKFWPEQFTADGRDAAAPAYERLLARCYDVLKAISPDNVVVGGELSSHGTDQARKGQGHSPVTFIQDMGKAYRLSHRKRPIMDEFGIHPYPAFRGEPIDTLHLANNDIGLGDYDRLVDAINAVFGGTAQPSSTLPIDYSEFAIESAGGQQNPTSNRLVAVDTVSEQSQAHLVVQAIQMAACQPRIRKFFNFLAFDDAGKASWHSGVYYNNGLPKSSLSAILQAINEAKNGQVQCGSPGSP
jgi:hypothetical protein